MRLFQTITGVVMAAFFVWLLLQMSRTPAADQRLLAMALAIGGGGLALIAGIALGGRGDRR